jgi:hypothetical protein
MKYEISFVPYFVPDTILFYLDSLYTLKLDTGDIDSEEFPSQIIDPVICDYPYIEIPIKHVVEYFDKDDS